MITREQAIAIVGLAMVEVAEADNCEPTSRCMPDADKGWVEYAGHAGDVTVYYWLSAEHMERYGEHAEDMADWPAAIVGYDVR